VRQLAIRAIAGYQKHLSPLKGFSCAHRLLHGGVSCSQYTKQVIAQEGLAAALHKSRQRFQECKQANQILRMRLSASENQPPEAEEPEIPHPEVPGQQAASPEVPKSSTNSNCDGNSADCALLGCECVGSGVINEGCAAVDCSAVDCGAGNHL
jgi:putative component of membrane protein insertase Oxa1/YidC/SpoIIIJ protein YidD